MAGAHTARMDDQPVAQHRAELVVGLRPRQIRGIGDRELRVETGAQNDLDCPLLAGAAGHADFRCEVSHVAPHAEFQVVQVQLGVRRLLVCEVGSI